MPPIPALRLLAAVACSWRVDRYDYRTVSDESNRGLMIDLIAADENLLVTFQGYVRHQLQLFVDAMYKHMKDRAIELVETLDKSMAYYMSRRTGDYDFVALPIELREFCKKLMVLCWPTHYTKRRDSNQRRSCCIRHMTHALPVAAMVWDAYELLKGQIMRAQAMGIAIEFLPLPGRHASFWYKLFECYVPATVVGEVYRERRVTDDTFAPIARCKQRFISKEKYDALQAAKVPPPKRKAATRAGVFISRAIKRQKIT